MQASPEPCRRVLTARVVETHSPRGSGAPWVRVSLPDGRTVQATRARDDYDGLVAELRSGDEVQVLTWRGDVVALRDAQGRILGTLATPSFGRLNWIMGALLGLFLVGAGVLGLCEQAIYHRRWSEHERLARAGEPPALPRVARSPAAPLLAAFFILGALLFPAAVLANAWLAGGVARWEALRHELLVGAMVGGAGLLIAWSRWGELRIETNRFVHRTWRTRTEVWFDDVERVITEPLPRGIGRAVCVVRRSAQTPVWLTTQQFHPCDLAVLLGALGRFKQDIDLDVNSRFLLAGTPWGHG